MIIPIIYEPYYNRDSIWCAKIRTGIERALSQKKYSSVQIDGENYAEYDYGKLFENAPRLLILVANRCSWILSALNFFSENNIGVVLVDCCPITNEAVKGQIYFHYENGTDIIFNHLSECGCKSTALYGVFKNSFADTVKQRAFAQKMLERGVTDIKDRCFENNTGLVNCYGDFIKKINKFDSVICTNEIAANSLIKRLKNDCVKIPDDLQIVSYGFTKLTDISVPSLTTLKFNSDAIGQQAISTFKYLYGANDNSIHITVRVSGELTVRDSTKKVTAPLPRSKSYDITDGVTSLNFYDDKEVASFSKMEKLLLSSDNADIQIIQKILQNIPYEQIADTLHLSRGTVFYRIKNMEEAVECRSLGEFKNFLISHQFEDIFSKNKNG